MVGKKYYAVSVGREVGVFTNWLLVKHSIASLEDAAYVSYATFEEADSAYKEAEAKGYVKKLPDLPGQTPQVPSSSQPSRRRDDSHGPNPPRSPPPRSNSAKQTPSSSSATLVASSSMNPPTSPTRQRTPAPPNPKGRTAVRSPSQTTTPLTPSISTSSPFNFSAPRRTASSYSSVSSPCGTEPPSLPPTPNPKMTPRTRSRAVKGKAKETRPQLKKKPFPVPVHTIHITFGHPKGLKRSPTKLEWTDEEDSDYEWDSQKDSEFEDLHIVNNVVHKDARRERNVHREVDSHSEQSSLAEGEEDVPTDREEDPAALLSPLLSPRLQTESLYSGGSFSFSALGTMRSPGVATTKSLPAILDPRSPMNKSVPIPRGVFAAGSSRPTPLLATGLSAGNTY
ncbi:hypothetical protein CYLTODRAFT_417316 [Cylindrobasidium torrendii FP15055 ss-10]|uniref:Ribonuclease H1 N-terminal domain-containing protein n=1 Tax=Cylindrobasidium torrendii FP15055 ss-10 TaxID=1314674 RepID=A0A0D7BR84_9AGAR|nr:hypothetical protein CYLTODRAFT_417316 [Cylindrobasidium torrendii FP15055 ss-10]